MKTQVKTSPVESGGLVSQGEFRIKQSAKAFSVLSSGLYSNKHQAILRELGCNAYDSHVEAGKADLPFKVHLPTTLNPTFFVEDYGIGLDHDGVVNIYTTYFESTKQDSNDYVGCMGLGSKSPFSYTDNFSITARKDGIERSYTAFINEEGVPAIALLAEQETDEPNGVRVQFAVTNRNDMYRFKEEAARVFKWFNVRPEITGQDVDIPEIVYAERDIVPGVHIRDTKGSYSYRSRQSYAIMGNVAYPINLEETEDNEDRRNDIKTMFEEGGLVIEFAIGELDIAASREELSYIQHTLDSIYRKGELIIDHLGKYIEKELTGAKGKWQRMTVLNRLYNSNKNLFAPAITSYVKKNPRKFFKYTRFNLYGGKTYFALKDFSDISEHLKVSYYNINRRYADDMLVANRVKTEHIREDEDDRDSDILQAWQLDDSSITVVMQDDKGGVLPRIKEAVKDKTITTRYVLSFRVTEKDADKDAIYKKVKRMLGSPKVVWTSSLPKTNTTHLKKKKLSVFKFYETYGSYHSEKWKWKLETDISKLAHGLPTNNRRKVAKHVYVPLQHKSVEMPGDNNTRSPDGFMRWVRDNGIDKFLCIDAKKIYGINKTTRKLITDDKDWVNFFDLFKQKFDKIDWKVAKEEARRKYIRRLVNDGDYDFTHCEGRHLKKLRDLQSPFGELTRFYVDNKNTKQSSEIQYDRLIIAMRMISDDEKKLAKLEKNLDVEKMDSDISELFKKVKKTYPILKHLDLNSKWHARNWEDAVEYIKLVDSTL